MVPSLGRTPAPWDCSLREGVFPSFVMHSIWLSKGVPFTTIQDKWLQSTKPTSMFRPYHHPYWVSTTTHSGGGISCLRFAVAFPEVWPGRLISLSPHPSDLHVAPWLPISLSSYSQRPYTYVHGPIYIHRYLHIHIDIINLFAPPLCIHPSIHLYTDLSIQLSIYLAISLSIYLFSSLSFH